MSLSELLVALLPLSLLTLTFPLLPLALLTLGWLSFALLRSAGISDLLALGLALGWFRGLTACQFAGGLQALANVFISDLFLSRNFGRTFTGCGDRLSELLRGLLERLGSRLCLGRFGTALLGLLLARLTLLAA